MHTFKKVQGQWCVHSLTGQTGQTVTVTKRNGQTSTVVLGEQVAPLTFALGRAPAPAAQDVGDLSRIIAMFDRARQHLRMPAIVLDGFRVNIAGQRARQPGSLTVTSAERASAGRRTWYGRVTLAGQFEPGRDAPAAIGETLRRFAADPVTVAAEYGRLHGCCCFCNRALRDERSTAVGYGPDCADNFGLPWGSRQPVERLPRGVSVAPTIPTMNPAGQPVPDEPFN
jgi:hypothetical protein